MGPKSKEAVCAVLGYILDEQQQQRSVVLYELGEIKSLLQRNADNDSADLVKVNKRVTELEKQFRGFRGGTPAPA